MATNKSLFFVFLLLHLASFHGVSAKGNPNYADALAKSILFFQGQRSGKLPPDQKIKWRSNSGLSDGSAANVDLTGGYYDAGDNVKFGLPMAFTTTMLAWSILEFGGKMSGQLSEASAAVKWGSDYLLKAATQTPGKLYVGVGDPNSDHSCWERPEDMDTPRPVFSVSPSNPGSDVAAETAAALAASALVLQSRDRAYARRLLLAAKDLMGFAMQYRGAYSDSVRVACPYYCSYSGYKDELLWGNAWLYRATKNATYLNFINSLGANDMADIFSWDNKFAGARVLLSRKTLVDKDKSFEPFRFQAEDFLCRILPNSPSKTTQYTPGGLIFKLSSANLQYVTSISFLLTTYAKYMTSSSHTFFCQNVLITSNTLRTLAKKQIDYILGQNPLGISYMVGFGTFYPQRVHHRGSSLPSIANHSSHIGCQEGFQYLFSGNPNQNLLTGAVVGGPDQNDAFSDIRTDYTHLEPATYINAPLVGSLAYLAGRYGSG
ncbi:endoglucanase 11-like [Carex rostrata]